MADTMRAAVVYKRDGRKRLEVREVPVPQPGPGEVLVRVGRVGLCGSDVHGFFDPDGTSRADGLIMGHEAGGHVAALGEGVTGPRVGTPVALDPQVACGTCPPCRAGLVSICDNKQVIGSSLRGFRHGALAEYIAVAARQVHPIPDTMSMADAASIEPLANATHAVHRAALAGDETVAVIGAGAIGLCLVQLLRSRVTGSVIATDVSASHLRLASELGANVTVNALEEDVVRVLLDKTGGQGVPVIFEAVGIDATYTQAIGAVRKRGTVIAFGAVQDTVTVPLLPILHKEISIVGSTGANEETSEAIALAAAGTVDLGPLVTHSYPLDRVEEAFETALGAAANGAIKVQVEV
jgi:threonine dehydrogenase-like Zn-dependent dehydrogenase